MQQADGEESKSNKASTEISQKHKVAAQRQNEAYKNKSKELQKNF